MFIPILFMGGLLGKLFHEFAMVLTVAIALSAVVSLTLTPMMCGRFMGEHVAPRGVWGWIDRGVNRAFDGAQRRYLRSLDWALRWRKLMLLVTLAVVVGTVKLYGYVPKGFLPIQDTGLMHGHAPPPARTSASPPWRNGRSSVVDALLADPAVESVGSTIGITNGWSSINRGQLTISLKPLSERKLRSEEVLTRLRPKFKQMSGIADQLVVGAGPARRRPLGRHRLPSSCCWTRIWTSCANGP